MRQEKGWRQGGLAARLGLAQTTIANYERGLRFPGESLLKAIADQLDVSLDFLLGRTDIERLRAGMADRAPARLSLPAREYLDLLIRGEGERAAAGLLAAAAAGRDVREIYLEDLAPALHEVGRLWQAGVLDAGQEHYAADVTRSVMERLQALHAGGRAAEPGGRVVCVCAGAEMHDLGLRMVAAFLAIDGWSVRHFGVLVPTSSVLAALEREAADLLAVSVTMAWHAESAAALAAAARSGAGVKVLAGGRAFLEDPGLQDRLGADAVAADAAEAVVVARRLLGEA